MKPDRPLIVALAFLATGVGLIVGYCQGTTGMNLAYPLSGSALHIDLTTTGPAVLGGVALTALGLCCWRGRCLPPSCTNSASWRVEKIEWRGVGDGTGTGTGRRPSKMNPTQALWA